MKGRWKGRKQRWRRPGEVTSLNKVTQREGNGLRQSEGRYERDRRSDSLKKIQGYV